MDGADQLRACLAIDGAVVNLQVQREAARRQPGDVVEAFDDVGLPQRLAAIEWTRMDARDLDAELAPVAGMRQRNVPHVEFDVDVRIFDPVWTVEAERHGDESTAKQRQGVEPRLEKAQDVLEANPALGCRGRVIDAQPGHVHVLVATLQAQEKAVRAGQLPHSMSPPPPTARYCAPDVPSTSNASTRCAFRSTRWPGHAYWQGRRAQEESNALVGQRPHVERPARVVPARDPVQRPE
jgi:hypothetical protein